MERSFSQRSAVRWGGLVCAVAAFCSLTAQGSEALGQGGPSAPVPARVVGVYSVATGPVILLEVVGTGIYVPIWVADREAEVARGYLSRQRQPRPLTHDLLLSAVSALGGQIVQVFVSDLQSQTYIGRIDIRQGSAVRQLDARSSDAICVGLGAGVPIFVMTHVVAQAGMSRAQLQQQGITVGP